MTDVTSYLKDNKGDCEGNQDRCNAEQCPIFGTLTKASRDGNRRVRGCGDPVARGRRNKRKGQRKQAAAVTALGMPRSSIHPGHEEFLGGTIRVEVKAGAQVGPVATRFLAAEAQSDASKAIGDHRPFAFVAMPDLWSKGEGLVVVKLSELPQFAAAFVEQWGEA